MNTQNARIWSGENPREVQRQEQHSPKLTVWCGIYHNKVLVPYYFDEPIVTGYSYLHLLNTIVRREMANLPRILFSAGWSSSFLPGWFESYIERSVNKQMDRKRRNVGWPTRSPDLNPAEFYLSGFINREGSQTPVTSGRMTRAEWSINTKTSGKVQKNL